MQKTQHEHANTEHVSSVQLQKPAPCSKLPPLPKLCTTPSPYFGVFGVPSTKHFSMIQEAMGHLWKWGQAWCGICSEHIVRMGVWVCHAIFFLGARRTTTIEQLYCCSVQDTGAQKLTKRLLMCLWDPCQLHGAPSPTLFPPPTHYYHLSLSHVCSLIPPIFSPTCLSAVGHMVRGRGKYQSNKYMYFYGKVYQGSITSDNPYPHVCTTSATCTSMFYLFQILPPHGFFCM